MLSYLNAYRPEWMAKLTQTPKRRLGLFLLGLTLLLPVFILKWTHFFVATVGITFLYIGYGCILLTILNTPLGVGLEGKLLNSPIGKAVAWVGLYSYPIYVWHILIAQLPIASLQTSTVLVSLPVEVRWIVSTIVFALISIYGGALLGKLIERPFLALRDRIFPSRSVAKA